jgi:hypothetical protein
MKTDREIYLNEVEKKVIKESIAKGKKIIIFHDLIIDLTGDEIVVMNYHTWDVFRVMNWD